jgi:hypothetical protein
MLRRTLLGLCAITIMVGTSGGQAAGKKMLGPTVAIPKGGSVQMLNNGHFKINGVSGTFDCSCYRGAGTCVTSTTTQGVSCTKGNTGTCTGDCAMSTTTTSISTGIQ